MRTDVEKLLRELVALPSVNPAFLPAKHPHAGEQRVADFLAVTAAKAGLDVAFQKVLPGRSNLLATLRPTGNVRQRILLAPHMDTVNVVSPEQFVPRISNGRLYGRGSCDTKGSGAAMLTALCSLAKEKQRPANTEIIFVGLIDEENGQSGSRTLAASGLKADLAIVGEPTNAQLVTAHKGSLWLEIETKGKAAHGSRPDLGRNAVHEMARIVDLLETKYAKELSRGKHAVLRPGTISIGTISGGTQPNIVPAQCIARADRRTLPGETEASAIADISRFLRKHNLSAKISGTKESPCLPMETDPHLPLVQQFLKVTRQSKPLGVDYYCDASVLSHAGIASVVFGPGDIAQAHTSDEWVSLSQLNTATDLLLKFFRSLS